MRIKLYTLGFLLFFMGWGLVFNAQVQELKDFENGKAKTFFGTGLPKSKGLKFSIKYPSFYTTTDVDDAIVVKAFLNELGNSGYSIVIQKRDTLITDDEKETILSKYSMQQNVTKAYKKYENIEYKKDLQVSGFDASYIEYYTDLNRNINTYMRQYAIVVNEYYIVTISFMTIETSIVSAEKLKGKFNAFKPFFEKVVTTFSVVN